KQQCISKNININVVFLDDVNERGSPRHRSCNKHYDMWKISELFQGKNSEKGYDNFYPGDRYWNNLNEYRNTLFLQIHKIKPIFKEENKNSILNDIDFFYLPVLLVPESIQITLFAPISHDINNEN
ncbi:MAG: hypothetical protein K2H11_00050, partial [Malacoplasma sp.]|nr:hypothetical protein [Malacoplasma sp.]